MVGEDAGDVLVVLGEPDRLGVEDVLDGEVEPAVPGEERADSEWTVVLGGVVHRGSAVLALPGQAMPASSYRLAGLNTCQVHDHRPVVRRQFSPSPRREVPSQATPFFSPPT